MESAPQADHIRFLFDPQITLTTFAGQRRRFGSMVESLSVDELESPSRCDGWSVADVLRHLVWVDATIRRIWSGHRFLAEGFDPRVTPNEAVLADRAISDEETQERYLSSTETMVAELTSWDPQRIGQPSLSPAGQVPWWMSAVHIGWDSSIHERDVLLPLGRCPEIDDNEIEPCLAYSLVLTSFFAGRDPLSLRVGTIQLRRMDGPVSVQVVTSSPGEEDDLASDTKLTGDPVGVIDAISGRGSIDDSLTGDSATIRRLSGLAQYFLSVPD
jgi:uncharacterized protein (TIGR03083 family)